MSITTDKPSKQYVPDIRAQYPVGGVPSTPLESRVGPHPKKDFLTFKSPPSRQLSREKRQEYQLDVSERFYDDYIGGRTTGFQVGHEVGQGVHKVGFDPNLYRANAYQALAYDPSRPVPRGLDFNHMSRVETAREKERVKTKIRQRRMSDSALLQKPHVEYRGQYGQPQVTGYDPFSFPTLPPVSQGPQFYQQRPQSAIQKNLEQSLRPELVPEVEKWLTSASKQEQQTAEKFLRTISSQGRRPDPASIASKHTSRVRSAVMTPSRQQRQDRDASEQYRQLEKYSKGLPQPLQVASKKKTQGGGGGGYRKPRRSNSDVSPVHGSMFTGTRQQKGHFTIHPEWASEGPETH